MEKWLWSNEVLSLETYYTEEISLWEPLNKFQS